MHSSPEVKKKVLIIEDQKDLRLLIEKKLSKEGYQAIAAISGEEGLQKARENMPDIILLDILLPEKDGYEVLATLKKTPGLSEIPVIVLSNSEPDEKKLFALGAKDFLVKSDLTPEEISARVASYINNGAVETKTAKAKPNQKSKHPKILLIEDDEVLRDLCVTKLRKENFEVSTAIDGTEGLRKIEKDIPDLILLDIILPGIDGFEVLKRMRSSTPQIAKVPVILLTNLGQETDIEKGEALGAVDYLVKANFTTEEIIEKIKDTLNNAKKVKQKK